MKTENFKMVNVSSYGKQIFEKVIIEGDILKIKSKYLSIAGLHLDRIFDRNFTENQNHFTVPFGYDTIHIYKL